MLRKPRPHSALSCLLILFLAACGTSETAMTGRSDAPASHIDPDVSEPYRRNPQPRRAYRITVTVDGAPGSFAQVRGNANYEIVDGICLPPAHPIIGVQMTTSDVMLPLTYKRSTDGSYTAIVHADAMVDADYFGRGVCRWKPTEVFIAFKATGSKEETAFVASLSRGELTAEGSETSFYWKQRYPRSGVDDYPDHGATDSTRYKPELQDELFTITIHSKALTR